MTESETVAGVTCAQDMMYAKNFWESMELEVKLPMILDINNKEAVDMAQKCLLDVRTKHMEIRMLLLSKLQ